MRFYLNLKRRMACAGYHPRRLIMVSWLPTLFLSLRQFSFLRVLIFGKTKLSLRGRITIERGSVLALNAPNFFSIDEPGSIIVGRGAEIQLRGGHFTIGSGAFIDIKDGGCLRLKGMGYFNKGIYMECRELISIGAGVAIGPNVFIQDCDGHQIEGSAVGVSPVYIGDHVWIGAGAKILKGVVVGDGAIIGAGAVVTRNVPAGCLAVGAPARVIRQNVSWS